MNKKIDFKILNAFINMIIMDVAQKYILKLKEERKKPPKLIEDYLDKSVLLLNKYKPLEISKMKNTIGNIDKEEQDKFNKLFEEHKDYEWLCKELNFAFLLMIDKELQEKTLVLIYDNVYEYKFLINQEIINKKIVDINKVIEKSNKNKIKKLHFYKNNMNGYMSV
ncbi:hypothetical protein [Spiroplasma platyhelix]|uniref:Uncharacterized protein n=1 Tax=Spiroplasma platyhelix PALS-1 TaxID=1276218 RepID=A0A846U2Q1_9MOLU|nr:hypothetical protein [Spiroplasma platyhelix]MBE4704430.1 hypothetical protein [Spiroplasma platyhelix PALS-1]NKE38799.1 hypothetical protein [Spiroplasma platyhelix PALS-1]UJB29012.1 hypothetical protein SPLAT_v1c02480 [Spiroplasma platyhelix PALS-1]